jgi:hypothetical protein
MDTEETETSYSGIMQMRYDFLMDNCPEDVKEMDRDGTMAAYLEKVAERYNERVDQLYPACMKSWGATQELAQKDNAEYLRLCNGARMMAEEIARHEIVEAL